MTVTNKTSVALEILGGSLKPNESREYTEMMFNTLDIHSEIGSCVITTVIKLNMDREVSETTVNW